MRVDTPLVSARAGRGVGVDVVVKIGGGLLAHAVAFDAVIAAVTAAGARRRLLVVPGGGPFADAVREVDRRRRLPDDAAHWMAVLGMDQYAYLLAAQVAGSVIVRMPGEIVTAHADGRVPVLAPCAWLREADPLPHTWDVTSDSIAAWVAGAVGAPRLVLIKPPHAAGESVVDPWFRRVLPPDVACLAVAADSAGAIQRALDGPRSGRD